MINEKSMTKTLDRQPQVLPSWYDNLRRQEVTAKDAIEEAGWAVDQLRLSRLRSCVEAPNDGIAMLSVILQAKSGKGIFSTNFFAFSSYLERHKILRPSFSDKYSQRDVCQLDGYLYAPGVSLISMDINSNRGLSVEDSWENPEDLKMPMSVEMLWALIVFPRLAEEIRTGKVSPFNLSGCHIGDDIVKPKRSVIIGPVDGQKELVMKDGHTFYRSPNWTTPTGHELLLL